MAVPSLVGLTPPNAALVSVGLPPIAQARRADVFAVGPEPSAGAGLAPASRESHLAALSLSLPSHAAASSLHRNNLGFSRGGPGLRCPWLHRGSAWPRLNNLGFSTVPQLRP